MFLQRLVYVAVFIMLEKSNKLVILGYLLLDRLRLALVCRIVALVLLELHLLGPEGLINHLANPEKQ